MLTCLDLFSGIGGFSLGFDRVGIKTTAFCEIEPYARRVLEKHWPGTPIYDDVRSLNAGRLRADGIALPDIIAGGFPCQDISLAGRGAGLEGDRSALWFEFLRLIEEIRPSWVLAENVSALRSRGLDTVLRGLASVGFDAEWHCIPARAVGAPHRRDRVWVLAYPNGQPEREPGHEAKTIGDSRNARLVVGGGGDRQRIGDTTSNVACPNGQPGHERRPRDAYFGPNELQQSDWWATEPDVGRVADGVPDRVDRLRCLGNAVVPQIPELIGRAIRQHTHLQETT